MENLGQLRVQIDEIDEQISRLFERRMEISEKVAQDKIRTGKAVFDMQRETEKLQRIASKAPDAFLAHGEQELLQQIMTISRKKQYQLLDGRAANEYRMLDSETQAEGQHRLPERNGEDKGQHHMPEKMAEAGGQRFEEVEALKLSGARVVYQGVVGSYSSEAAGAFFNADCEIRPVAKFRDVMEALEKGEADYGVLPIENSTAGTVYEVCDLLKVYQNRIVGEQLIRCRHALLGVPGSSIHDIRVVYSHEQALAQCRTFLDAHADWEQIAYSNTAAAAQKVAREKDPSQAAIASTYAAEQYHLDVLQEHIYMDENNSTRFIVVTPEQIFLSHAKKISLCVEIAHESGSLYHMLSHFIYNNLNMTKIESRPIPDRSWEYRFFIDLEGNLRDSAVRNALRGVEAEAGDLCILGCY